MVTKRLRFAAEQRRQVACGDNRRSGQILNKPQSCGAATDRNGVFCQQRSIPVLPSATLASLAMNLHSSGVWQHFPIHFPRVVTLDYG